MFFLFTSTLLFFFFFFFNDTATTEIYTLSLHDALPISQRAQAAGDLPPVRHPDLLLLLGLDALADQGRSEEHTSELQSHSDLVCRLLLEKKKKKTMKKHYNTIMWQPQKMISV